MPFKTLKYFMPAGVVQVSALPAKSWGSLDFSGDLKLPSTPSVEFGLWPGTGSQLGLADVPVIASGTLTNTTPGVTDQYDIDLTTDLDLSASPASIDELVHMAVFLDSQNDGVRIYIDGTVTNAFTAIFRDMANPELGRLSIPAGFVHPTNGQAIPGGAIIWGGNLSSMPVDATHKIIRLKLAAGTSAPFRVVLLGRSAAS
jgi:hypothetical protein